MKNCEKEERSRVKIFVGYYKPNYIFKSNVYQPILTSSIDWNAPDLIRDDTGINISEKNKHYGELTGNYWVWKNFVPTTNAEYIGYCHYRRFLDFNMHKMKDVPFKPIKDTEFKKIFKEYTEENILNCIEGYDIILPQKLKFGLSILDQYFKYHPLGEFNLALKVIEDLYPEYLLETLKLFGAKEMVTCLHFVMKKELFNEYMEWLFNILFTIEERTDWSKYNTYNTVRVPAYLAERLFNVWLNHNIEKRKLKVLNTTSFILIGKDYGSITYEKYIKWYYNTFEKFYKSKI